MHIIIQFITIEKRIQTVNKRRYAYTRCGDKMFVKSKSDM